MIFELRTYDLGIGKLPGYVRLFERVGFPILCRYARPVGFWFAETGPLNRIHHMWAYSSRAERAEGRAALYADPDWLKDFIPYALPHLERQANVILAAENGDPFAHPRAGATDGKWLYEFTDHSGPSISVDTSVVCNFRAVSGDLSRRLCIRSFENEGAYARAVPWPAEARAVCDTFHPVPFSVLS